MKAMKITIPQANKLDTLNTAERRAMNDYAFSAQDGRKYDGGCASESALLGLESKGLVYRIETGDKPLRFLTAFGMRIVASMNG